jgi:hypothetical protein
VEPRGSPRVVYLECKASRIFWKDNKQSEEISVNLNYNHVLKKNVKNLATKPRVMRRMETLCCLNLRHVIFCGSVDHMSSFHET